MAYGRWWLHRSYRKPAEVGRQRIADLGNVYLSLNLQQGQIFLILKLGDARFTAMQQKA
mgnify:CR=1 FL=1